MFIFLATLCVLLFQNCSGEVKGVPNGPYSFTALDDNELFTIRSGLIFKNEFKTDPLNLTGLSVCDYPDLSNCADDFSGALRGQTRYWETSLTPSSSVHRLKFTFRSNGYFQSNQNSESQILIGLRGRVAFSADRTPQGLNGRGIGLGSRSSTNSTCLNRSAALLGFYDDAHSANLNLPSKQLFSASCSDSLLQDGKDYHFEIYASISKKIGIKIFNSEKQLIHSSLLMDNNSSLNPNLTGVFLSHRNPKPLLSSNDNWNFTLSNLSVNQSTDSIESFFSEVPLSFYLGGAIVANQSLISTLDLTTLGLSVGTFSEERYRVFTCLGTSTEITMGVACQNGSEFNEVLFSSNPHFIFSADRLALNGVSLFQGLPTGEYQLIVRLNPEDITGQARVRIFKPF